MEASVDLHPDLAPLAFLLGRWKGEARSLWDGPEIIFSEETVFEHSGKPYLAYRQQTWRPDGVASHAESGFVIVTAPGEVALTIAQPSGVVEVSTGTVLDELIEASSISVALSPAAKLVSATSRRLTHGAGTLRYLLRVALGGEELADHIAGELHRVE